uniref:Uncharacterized protein n=1 Tax=Zea mays TaxID=4577 RepID=A0A804LKA6_MAIZE
MNNKDILTHKFDEQSTKFLSQFTPTQWDKDQWTKSLLWFSLYLNDISDKRSSKSTPSYVRDYISTQLILTLYISIKSKYM